ncbi:hypothetical protein [Haloechinothrix salitolerans]|uniref:Plasmid replication, integration and excision activator n=1 Tax=Haloechinothrix salitolerans TaxID=926830 RepID=A0ABW2C4H3_9PSEU
MRLILDTSQFNKVEVTRPFAARVDNEGNQRRDKQGGTGLPLWACQVAVYTDDGAEVLQVTVADDNPPELIREQRVTLDGLEAMPWATNKGEPRVAYRAKSVMPVSTAKSTTTQQQVKAAS